MLRRAICVIYYVRIIIPTATKMTYPPNKTLLQGSKFRGKRRERKRKRIREMYTVFKYLFFKYLIF